MTSCVIAVWDGSSWTTPQSIGAYAGAEPQNLRLAFDPGSDAMVLVVDDVNADDYALVWDGDTWGNAVTLDTPVTPSPTSRRSRSRSRRRAATRWSPTARTATADVYYRIWNGSELGSGRSLAATTGIGTQTAWLSSANDPNSDRIVLGVTTTGNEAWAAVWNGTGWEDAQTLLDGSSATTTGSISPNLAVAFEHATGEALVTYGKGGQTGLLLSDLVNRQRLVR